ncbi:MAG: PepSY-associated TM helix domain-containing protein [Deltaproteobacteria bacterium]
MHSLLGAVSGLALVLLGVTGALLVFSEPLDHALFRHLHEVEVRPQRVSLDALFEAARARHTSAHTVRVRRFPTCPDQSLEFLIGQVEEGADGWALEYVNPYSGAVLGNRSSSTRSGLANPFGFLLSLHSTFLIGKKGRLVLGLLSIALLGSLLSGAIVYRRSVLDVLRWRVRLRARDLMLSGSGAHRIVGVWALGFNALIASTGFWMARAAFTPAFHRPPPSDVQPALAFSLDRLLEQLGEQAPGFVPARMSRVGRKGEARITGRQVGQLSLLSGTSSHVTFDVQTGAVTRVSLITAAPLADQLEAAVQPLHFGTLGGRLTQAGYVAGGLALPLLSVSGLVLWWRRRRRRVRGWLRAGTLAARTSSPGAARS